MRGSCAGTGLLHIDLDLECPAQEHAGVHVPLCLLDNAAGKRLIMR